MKERLTKLFGMLDQNVASATVREIPVDRVRANPFQPRRQFDDEELKELATSIEAYGLLQPVLVRPPRAILGTNLLPVSDGCVLFAYWGAAPSRP